MERFLNDEAVQRSKARVRSAARLFTCLGGLALALFILLCLLTRTGNARLMLAIAMAAMIAAGWGMICLWLFLMEPARAEAQHLASLAKAEKQIREGRFFLTGDRFRIPKSVRVQKARLETADGTLSLNVSEKLAEQMPPDGSLVQVETARKFITGMFSANSAASFCRQSSGPCWQQCLSASYLIRSRILRRNIRLLSMRTVKCKTLRNWRKSWKKRWMVQSGW